VLPMVNQAAGARREGVVDSADTIDLATVMGTGLAPFRGGLTHFADTAGLPDVVRRLDELATKHGSRFAPDPLLRELVASGGSFAKWTAPPLVHRDINTASTQPSAIPVS
jgi:hypothetical protein